MLKWRCFLPFAFAISLAARARASDDPCKGKRCDKDACPCGCECGKPSDPGLCYTPADQIGDAAPAARLDLGGIAKQGVPSTELFQVFGASVLVLNTSAEPPTLLSKIVPKGLRSADGLAAVGTGVSLISADSTVPMDSSDSEVLASGLSNLTSVCRGCGLPGLPAADLVVAAEGSLLRVQMPAGRRVLRLGPTMTA
mmetsp:Transcript_12749/g.40206  ORF Transcript_12749/g.40206 Transcript_12749/m.40206 type:complete len:197 (-) Transcript_12749:61-651(-)